MEDNPVRGYFFGQSCTERAGYGGLWICDLGLIENLDHVTYVYQSEGVEKMHTITAEDASTFLG